MSSLDVGALTDFMAVALTSYAKRQAFTPKVQRTNPPHPLPPLLHPHLPLNPDPDPDPDPDFNSTPPPLPNPNPNPNPDPTFTLTPTRCSRAPCGSSARMTCGATTR